MCDGPRPPKSAIDPVHPLSVLYEILRGWKMPELYEYAGTLDIYWRSFGPHRENCPKHPAHQWNGNA